MIVKELIYNRWFAQEGNVTYSESGTIERIEQLEDGTYDLYLRRRWDNDITAFKEQDVDYGSVNNLNSTGEYYDSWFRVLNVMQALTWFFILMKRCLVVRTILLLPAW